MKTLDSRNRDPEPPVILDPLVVLLSARAVTAALGLWKPVKPDWIGVR